MGHVKAYVTWSYELILLDNVFKIQQLQLSLLFIKWRSRTWIEPRDEHQEITWWKLREVTNEFTSSTLI